MDNKIERMNSLRGGVLFWLAFSVVAVALRGVRWDETYEHAQALLGVTPYPADHPFYILERNAFTINAYFSAALLWLSGSPLVVCGLRNVAHLAMSIVPVFLLTSQAARRTLAGHVAVVVTLLGSLTTFASFYPLAVWPNGFSNGPIGQGWALLILYFLIGGRLRVAYFMLGLMPLIHIGQAPIVFVIGGLLALGWLWRGETGRFLDALRWGIAGFAPCVVFFIVQKLFLQAPLPTTGPYYSPEDGHAIWQAYAALYDVHGVRPRFAPLSHRNIVLVGALLLVGAAAWREKQRRDTPPVFFWMLAYISVAVAVMGIVGLLQTIFGAVASFWLLAWMPYRFGNHVALIALAAAAALLLRREGEEDRAVRAGQTLVLLILLYVATLPMLARIVPGSLFDAYLGGATENVAFALWGGAAAILWLRFENRRVWGGIALLGAIAALGAFHQYGALCVAAGFVVVAIAVGLPGSFSSSPQRHRGHGELQGRTSPLVPLQRGTEGAGESRVKPVGRERYFEAPALLLLAVIIIAVLAQETYTREHLPRTEFERRVTAVLEDRGEQDALLLAPFWQIYLQARTGHPVFADYQTSHWMIYIPALAPSLKKMHFDLFGKRIDEPYELDLNEWVARSPEQWADVGRAYSFRYVVSPVKYPLRLTEVFREGDMALYEIPRAAQEGS